MSTRPQTLYGLADSPVDLAAFILDHGDGTGQPGLVEQAVHGQPVGDLTCDDLLDNITLYWLTNTGVSSARFYWENKADFFDAKNISVPFAISVFPDELYQAPRSWAERAYRDNLIYFNELDRGEPLRGVGAAGAVLQRDASGVRTAQAGGSEEVTSAAAMETTLKQLDAGLLSVGYAEAGPADGPVVLLLHGCPMTSTATPTWPRCWRRRAIERSSPTCAATGPRVFSLRTRSATASRPSLPSTPSR